jgi:hypothetical protein
MQLFNHEGKWITHEQFLKAKAQVPTPEKEVLPEQSEETTEGTKGKSKSKKSK